MKIDAISLLTGTPRQTLGMLHHAIAHAGRHDHLPVYRAFVTSLSRQKRSH